MGATAKRLDGLGGSQSKPDLPDRGRLGGPIALSQHLYSRIDVRRPHDNKAANGRCSSLVHEAVERNSPTTKDEIFAAPNDIHLVVIWQSVEHDFGPKEMDRIFWCAAFEGIKAEPKSLLYLYDGLVSFFLFDDLIYDHGYHQAWSSADSYATVNLPLWRWAMYGGEVIKVIALLIAFATLIPTWQHGGSQRALAAMLWATILYLAAVHVVFASAHWRYIEPVIPGLVLLAGLGLSSLKNPSADAGVDQSMALDRA
jgi:hypothetical protein